MDNWYGKIYDYEKACGQVERLDTTRDKIRFDNIHGWCEENPDVDNLRLEAVKAIEAYSNAIKRYCDGIEKEIVEKMYEEETVINWKVLKKKLGRV